MPCHASQHLTQLAEMQAADAQQQLAALKAASAAERMAKHSLEGQQTQLQGTSSRLERQLAAAEAERESLSAQLKVHLCYGKFASKPYAACTAGCWWACLRLAPEGAACTIVRHMKANRKRCKAAGITIPPKVASGASPVLCTA